MIVGIQRTFEDQIRIVDAFRRRRFRTHSQFAEEEIIIPSGPLADQPFRLSTQPFSRLFYDEIDSGKYSEVVVTGPSQTGKTLLFWVVPLLRVLFELCETVVCAVPDFDIVADKIEQDLEPVLRKTRYWKYMPAVGRGSKGGRASKIKFKHGPELRWMTAGGGDKSRAGYTARVVLMTETDGFDVQASTSAESTKIAQIEARQRAWDSDRRFTIKEGTLTLETAHTWSRFCEGTASRLAIKCRHCDVHVSPEREHLVGWQTATSELMAKMQSSFYCPACGEAWSEDDRIFANRNALLVHRGQQVVDGAVVGDPPATQILGLRWSAVNNLLLPAGNIGGDEFRAAKSANEDASQREMCQFIWAIPYRPIDDDNVNVSVEALATRMGDLQRGQIPENAVVSLGIDVNKPVLHWTVVATMLDGSCGFIVDYGKQGLRTREIGFQAALIEGLSKLMTGLAVYPIESGGIDSRWRPDDIADAIKATKEKRRLRAFIGCGKGQFNSPDYRHPATVAGDVVSIGNRWFEKIVRARNQICMNADANFWKLQVQTRVNLVVPDGETSSKIDSPIRLFRSVDESGHVPFCRQLLAEEMRIEHDPKRGPVNVFVPVRTANHWLDSTSIALVFADKLLRRKRTAIGRRAVLNDGDAVRNSGGFSHSQTQFGGLKDGDA